MVVRSSNCLLDGLCEIIIPVQILVTLSYTGRPFAALLLRVEDWRLIDSLSGADAF